MKTPFDRSLDVLGVVALAVIAATCKGDSGVQGLKGDTGIQGQKGDSGSAGVAPSGAVVMFNLASCPNGWTVLTAAQGRYLVGLPGSGTLAGTAGTALANLENRATGLHTHAITDFGHVHAPAQVGGWGFVGTPDSGTTRRVLFGFKPVDAFSPTGPTSLTSVAPTGISVQSAGAVSGTNAPYIQLLPCQKM